MTAEIRAPQSPDELWQAIRILTGLRIPRVAVCVGHSAPFDALCAAYFATANLIVWKASRGFGGKTKMLALLGYLEEVFLAANVGILGGSGEQAQRVHAYQVEWWESTRAPRYLLKSDPSARRSRLSNGGSTTCLTASRRSVRGIHPQRLRLDEIDEMDIRIYDAAMGQTMKAHGLSAQTVASSTHQNPEGTMTEVLNRAAEQGHPVFEWCYRESMTEWLDQEQVDIKRTEVTESMWLAEYELQEPSVEGRAIMTEAVDTMFDAALGEYEGAPGEAIEVEPPMPGGRYAHGADWAKSVDWTVIATLRVDVVPYRLVAYQRIGRTPWPEMAKVLDDRIARYGGVAAHDATGLGAVVSDLLHYNVEAVTLGGATRSAILNEYISSIERGELRAPRIAHVHREHKLAKISDLFGIGHLPDTLCALALARRAANSTVGSWANYEDTKQTPEQSAVVRVPSTW